MGSTLTARLVAAVLAVVSTLAAPPQRRPADRVYQGKPLRVWLKALDPTPFGDSERRKEAEGVLDQFCANEKDAIKVLAACLRDDEGVRLGAVTALERRGPGAAAAIPALLGRLKRDPSETIRHWTVRALPSVDPAGRRVLPALLHSLAGDNDGGVRSSAAFSIRQLKPPWGAIRKQMTASLRDPAPAVRAQVVCAVGELSDPRAGIPLLIGALLKEDDVSAIDMTAWALTHFGDAGWSAVYRALADKGASPLARSRAAVGLGYVRVHSEGRQPLMRKSVPLIVPLLAHRDVAVRRNAASALSWLGEYGAAAVPQLAKALADPDVTVRAYSASALAGIGRAAAPAVPALSRALKDKESSALRKSAARALGHIGPKAKGAVPALVEALDDSDAVVGRLAAEALGAIGSKERAVLRALRKASLHKEAEVRRAAAQALKQLQK